MSNKAIECFNFCAMLHSIKESMFNIVKWNIYLHNTLIIQRIKGGPNASPTCPNQETGEIKHGHNILLYVVEPGKQTTVHRNNVIFYSFGGRFPPCESKFADVSQFLLSLFMCKVFAVWCKIVPHRPSLGWPTTIHIAYLIHKQKIGIDLICCEHFFVICVWN